MTRLGRGLLGLFLVVVCLLIVGPMASVVAAHASLVASSPADGQSVGGLMEQIDLVFNEAIDAELVTVRDPDGVPVDALVTQPSSNHLRIGLVSPLEIEGSYRIEYQLISSDEDPLTLSLSFSYESGADPALPVVALAATEIEGGGYAWVIVGGLTFVVVALGVRFVRSRRALRRYI